MGIDVRWYDQDKTIVQLVLNDPWDWPDFEQQYYTGLEMSNEVKHTVYCVVEFAGGRRRPQGNALMHLRRVTQQTKSYPNAGACILINPHPFARSMIGLLLRIYGENPNLVVTGSMEDAFGYIQARSQAS